MLNSTKCLAKSIDNFAEQHCKNVGNNGQHSECFKILGVATSCFKILGTRE